MKAGAHDPLALVAAVEHTDPHAFLGAHEDGRGGLRELLVALGDGSDAEIDESLERQVEQSRVAAGGLLGAGGRRSAGKEDAEGGERTAHATDRGHDRGPRQEGMFSS